MMTKKNKKILWYAPLLMLAIPSVVIGLVATLSTIEYLITGEWKSD